MVSTDQFICTIKVAYDEVVLWKINLFFVPTGRVGNSFVNELASLFSICRQFSAGSYSSLCIHGPTNPFTAETSKSREHSQCLERRLVSWR